MKKSKLESESKKTIFKKAGDFIDKLMAYLIDGIPIDKNIDITNHVVYSKLPEDIYKNN